MSSEAIDLAQKIQALEDEIKRFNDNIKTILQEVGAPSMQELMIRYKRFGALSIELPEKMAVKEAQIESLRTQLTREQESYTKLHTINSGLRKECNTYKQLSQLANSKATVAAEAMHVALHLLESPAFSSLKKEARAAVRALTAAMRELNAPIAYAIKEETDDQTPSA